MNVLEKLERRIKRLKQEELGFHPKLDDECRLLEAAAARIRELETAPSIARNAQKNRIGVVVRNDRPH